MNDKQLKSYYLGNVSNLSAHISNLESLIRDMKFGIGEYNKKIAKIEQSEKNQAKALKGGGMKN